MSGPRLLAMVVGFWILMRAVNKDATGRTLIDHLVGNKASQSALLSTSLGGGGGGGGLPVDAGKPNAKGQVNPFGTGKAIGSRLDQGFDVTAKDFLAPFTGKVVVSKQSDPGWAGGGYIAIQNATNPSQVVYIAEGISPVVSQGQTVRAGQRIGIPVRNPYNFTLGNVEIGPANPKNPLQPLAQAVSNKSQVVWSFYRWLLGLGGPKATSTARAGYA